MDKFWDSPTARTLQSCWDTTVPLGHYSSPAGTLQFCWGSTTTMSELWVVRKCTILRRCRTDRRTISDLRVSRVQCGLFSPPERSITPEFCRSLLLRSRSLRLEDCELRTEDRASQLLHVRLQPLSLKKILRQHYLISPLSLSNITLMIKLKVI